jgi:hypothetical protein
VIRDPTKTAGVKALLNDMPGLAENQLNERYRKWVQDETQAGRPPTLEIKARKVVEIYRDRIFAFRDELRRAGALYDDANQADRDASVRMFLGGQEIANPGEKDAILNSILSSRAV